ncbi:hypothetical protein H0H81_005836 [Sphagnurus paluster]|uniref:NADH:flavin oxidoreductase/NADH oxidase N-terminal domain-containing protein n=1 Tax=Sphagnurus paluster TaxID=117069 RepID=A0A9P7FTN3_9AGAR|nr:hypothetical protein H0H81_005836 [Sphagnurus paluster]
MATITTPRLFQPIQVGNVKLSHRVVLAPLTRMRSTKSTHIPVVPLVKEYYSQRARVPGTLLITEATDIAPQSGGYGNVPGIWSEEQINAWKEITDAVHAKGSFIFLQIWALGRVAPPDALASHEPPLPLLGPSAIPISTRTDVPPRPMTAEEIEEFKGFFAQAAHNAVHLAGFDGVELHGANGYLLDQFLQDVTNDRTDGYGGSVEGRSRFVLEVVDAVARAVGPERTALRLSPWSNFQEMGMADPIPQFTHLVTSLRATHPDLAYIHVIESRVSGNYDRDHAAHESNDFIREIWAGKPYISAGGYTRERALEVTTRSEWELTAFGRFYISNPDLPLKLKHGAELRPYDRKTFYTPAESETAHVGYSDYPFAEESLGKEIEVAA